MSMSMSMSTRTSRVSNGVAGEGLEDMLRCGCAFIGEKKEERRMMRLVLVKL